MFKLLARINKIKTKFRDIQIIIIQLRYNFFY